MAYFIKQTWNRTRRNRAQSRGHWLQIRQQIFQIPTQKYSNQMFSFQNLKSFVFAFAFPKLWNKINSKGLTSNLTNIFQICCPKHLNEEFLAPKEANSKELIPILQLYFQISAGKCPNKAFLIPNLDIFILAQFFVVRQIWRRWFQIWKYNFQLLCPKITKIRHFWCQIQRFLFFHQTLE